MIWFLLAFIIALAFPASAHDSWINRGGYRNSAGTWCCGEDDCSPVLGVQHVSLPTAGYRLPSGEFVPEDETLPSPDGLFWRCHDPAGKRRCFFAPPEGA